MIDFSIMSPDDVNGFRDYLRNEYTLKEENPVLFDEIITKVEELIPQNKEVKKHQEINVRSENYLKGVLKQLAAVVHYLNAKNIISNDPFKKVTIGKGSYLTPFYLTKDERNKIANYDFSQNERLEVQRDIFIFQCLSGCRVSDLMQLTKNNIYNGELSYTPHKTSHSDNPVHVNFELGQTALRLISKYENNETGKLFPFISSKKYNKAIKKILEIVGIDRPVEVSQGELRPLYEVASSHMARRTFIGQSYLIVSDPSIIGKMSGHVEGSEAFARYRNIEKSLLKNVISAIE